MSNAKVLFLCTGNSARSQMAEAFLRRYAGDHFEVYSAGLEPKPVNPYTVRVMREAGIDIRQQTSKDVFQYLGRVNFGYIITVCPNAEAHCPIFPGISFRFYWPFDDPAAVDGTDDEKLAKFREVRDQIDQRIRAWLIEQHLTPLIPSDLTA